MRRIAGVMLGLALAVSAVAETKLLVTVTDKKSGAPVTDLVAGDFVITADKVPKRIEKCEYGPETIDVMLLLDSSLVGESVVPFSGDLIRQLNEKEQMAVVSYHSMADLVQDFTGSQDLLRRSVSQIQFGNSPRLLDALYAAITDGFDHANFRHVILLLTSGIDGPSRVSDKEVIRLARRSDVSIYPVFLGGYGKSLFARLARETGGASFSLREMGKRVQGSPAAQIFEVMRNHYTMTLTGNLPLGDNVVVELNRKDSKNYLASALPLD